MRRSGAPRLATALAAASPSVRRGGRAPAHPGVSPREAQHAHAGKVSEFLYDTGTRYMRGSDNCNYNYNLLQVPPVIPVRQHVSRNGYKPSPPARLGVVVREKGLVKIGIKPSGYASVCATRRRRASACCTTANALLREGSLKIWQVNRIYGRRA